MEKKQKYKNILPSDIVPSDITVLAACVLLDPINLPRSNWHIPEEY